MGNARRYNKGKLRYELIPTNALADLAEVYTKGAFKYTLYDENENLIDDGSDNWRLGMPWRDVMASVKRHIQAWERGEDIDPDPSMGTKHLANAAWGLFTLLEYYRIHPQGDNRVHQYLHTPRIGLDIDEVLADWVGHWTKYHKQETPETWNFDRNIGEKFDKLKNDKEFWLSIPTKVDPKDIPFEPHCYITSRSIPVEWTQEWIDKSGFPTMPVYSVPFGESKVEVAKKAGVEWFVDDRYENFVELNKAGICTFLFDAPHNQRYDVGYKRIYSLKQLLYA